MVIVLQRVMWKGKCAKKRAKFELKKQQLLKRLTSNGTKPLISDERETILSHPILELLSKLKNNELDPVDVLEAYQVHEYAVYCLEFAQRGFFVIAKQFKRTSKGLKIKAYICVKLI